MNIHLILFPPRNSISSTIKPVHKRRPLRTYRHLASVYHGGCSECGHDIEPGDEYEADVWIVYKPTWMPARRSCIQVWKRHTYCPHDPWKDDVDNEYIYACVLTSNLPQAA